MKIPMNTAEAKDISEIYVNLVKQDKLAETMDRSDGTNPIDSQAQLTAIQEELAKLRKEFDEFIK